MLFYLILFGAITGYGYLLCNKTKLKYRNEIFVITAVIILCVISAIRFEVGYDCSYEGYTASWRYFAKRNYKEYIECRNVHSKRKFEKGYVILVYFLKNFGLDDQVLYIGTSILIAILAGIFLYTQMKDKVWGFFLLYGIGAFYFSLNLIRQVIAAFIFAFAIVMAKNKKIIPYMLLTLLAASFHKTALLMIPFYFILQIKFTKKTLIIYSLITAIIFFASPYAIDLVGKLWYNGYMDSIYILNGNQWFYLITPVVLFIIIFIFRDKICEDDKSNNIYINCAFFNMFFYIIGCRHAIVDRFTVYFEPALIVGLCILICKLKEENSQHFKKDCAVIIAAILTINIIYLVEDGHGIIPYDTIFTNEYYLENGKYPEH